MAQLFTDVDKLPFHATIDIHQNHCILCQMTTVEINC